MNNKRTVTERLREMASKANRLSCCDAFEEITGIRSMKGFEQPCEKCMQEQFNALAGMIEAEQTELRERVDELNSTFIDLAALDLLCEKLDMSPDLCGIAEQIRTATKSTKRPHEVDVDVDALLKLAEDMEEYFAVPPYKMLRANPSTVSGWEKTIRKAVKGVPSWSDLKGVFADNKPQLPDGIEWPRFEDGELVGLGDKAGWGVVSHITFGPKGCTAFCNMGIDELFTVSYGEPVKRTEPEVLDADGVPIKVGDIVYGTGREEHRYSVVNPAHPEGEGRFMVKCEDLNECEFCFCDPSMLTHHAPVRDADGVPIKVGDEVWYTNPVMTAESRTVSYIENEGCFMRVWFDNGFWGDAKNLTHRKPDTFESVAAEMLAEIEGNDNGPEIDGYLARFRKLLGGE